MDITLDSLRDLLVEEVFESGKKITEERGPYGRDVVLKGTLKGSTRFRGRFGKPARLGITHALGNAVPDTFTISILSGSSPGGESRVFYVTDITEEKMRSHAQKIMDRLR